MTHEHAHVRPVDTSGDLIDKGLKKDSLGFKDSVVIGLASTAPAYSLAATLGFIILEVGDLAPAAILIAFIPMLFTSFAYRELNAAVPDSGTTFTWGTKAFGPWVGWTGGWAVAFSGTIFLASAGEVAAYYFYDAVGLDSLLENRAALVAGGVVVIALMAWVAYRGIDISRRVQDILIVFQFGALALFAGILLYSYYADDPAGGVAPSLSMFNLFGFEDFSALIAAIVLAVFLFWGWESTLSINEETEGSDSTPGRAAVTSTLLLLLTYLTVTVAVLAYGGIGDGLLDFSEEAVAAGSADDVFSPLGEAAAPALLTVFLLAIVISALSTTQTTILPTTRGTLAMAVYKALPEKFGHVHPKYLSPSYSTSFMAIVAAAFYVGMSLISENVLYDTLYSIGLAITFYYALTGFACIWYFRRDLTVSFRNLMLQGILPLVGGLALTFVFAQSAIDMSDPVNNYTTLFGIGGAFVIGVGALLLGLLVMILWSFTAQAKPFFRGQTLTRDTPVLVPEDQHAVVLPHEAAERTHDE